MRINTNISAIDAYNNLSKVQDQLSSSMQKLSSGFRINNAGDDAAGLGIANQLAGDIGAMNQASNNADQAGSVLQIMDGATQNIQSILERMEELASQSASDTVDDSARTKINNEFQSLSQELDRIVQTTKFQSANLLDGTFGTASAVQGSVSTGSSFLGAHVANVNVTSGAKFEGLAGNVTASVVKQSNSVATSVNGATVNLISGTGQTTLNGLTAGTITLAATQNATTATASATGEGSASATTLGAVTISNQNTAGALVAGTWTISTAADSDGTGVDVTFTNGTNPPIEAEYNSSSTALDLGGISIALGGTIDKANLLKLDGATVNVTQNYSIQASGAGATTQTATIADSGSAQTAAFSNYGINFSVASGTANSFNGKTIAVTENDALQLTDGFTTQSVNLNANPANQVLDFSNLGLNVTLNGSATAANLKSDIAQSRNTIQRASLNQAQFLVSASQNYTGADLIKIDSVNLSAQSLGVGTSQIDLTSAAGAQQALTAIDGAITQVGTALGNIGAAENRVNYASTNVKTSIQNFTAAESTIKDVDMASEMTNFSKEQIMVQAGTAMLAQANQLGASVLKLFQ